jgi:hypothetical protein
VIYTNYRVVQENRQAPEAKALQTNEYSVAEMDVEALYVKNFIQNHSAIFPREAVHGRQQDPHLSSLDDWDFLLNVASDTPFTHANIVGAVVGATRGLADSGLTAADLDGLLVLAPGFGAQGASLTDISTIFGGATKMVIPSVSRSVARDGLANMPRAIDQHLRELGL